MLQKKMNQLHNLEDVVKFMSNLLNEITIDLEKSNKGNKAAAQRVRTGTVKLEKVAKLYRKESILSEKAMHSKAKSKSRKTVAASAKAKAPAHKSAQAKAPSAKAIGSNGSPKAAAKGVQPKTKAAPVAAAKAKVKTQKAIAKPKAFAVKKPTAKLPIRSR